MKEHERLVKLKPAKALLTLSVPSVIMQLIDEANSMIDAVFLGRFFGPDAVASMSIVFPFILILISFGSIFATGAMIIVGKKLGGEDIQEANEVFMTTTAVLTVISTMIGLVAFLTVPKVLSVYDINGDIYVFAKLYMQAISLGLPVMTIGTYFNEIIYTEGHAKMSLILMIIQLVLNVIVNYMVIGILQVGPIGIVVATVFTMLFEVILMVVYVQSKHMTLSFRLSDIRVSKNFFATIIPLGMPAFVSTLLLSITLGVESNVIADFGSTALSVQTITGYLFSMSSSIATGILNAALVIMSYSVGAKDKKRFNQLLQISLLSVLASIILMNSPLVINSSLVVAVFTDAPAVAELIKVPAVIYGLSAPFIFGTNVYLYVMQLIGMEKTATKILVFQQLILFLPLLFIFKSYGFVYAVSAQPIAEIVGGFVTLKLLPKFYNKMKLVFAGT